MTIKKISFISACFMAVIVAIASACPPAVVGNLSLEHRWVRSSTGPNTAAYMTINNSSVEPDKLTKVDSEDAAIVELHNHIEEDGVMKMRPVPFIEIGDPVEMKPGGLHIMLMGLKASFQGKQILTLTLHFEKAGSVNADFPVKAFSTPSQDTARRSQIKAHKRQQ